MLKIELNVFMRQWSKRDWHVRSYLFQRTEIWRISDSCARTLDSLNGFHFNKISNLTYSKQLWLTL